METVAQTLEKNLDSKESDCRTCESCGEPIEKIVFLPGFNRWIKGPMICSCKKAALQAKEIVEANKEKQLRLKQIIKNSLMDDKFKQCNFENWDHKQGSKKMYSIGLKYAKNFNKIKAENVGLLIYGEPGNGKTYVASCIANNLLSRMIPCVCVSINALLDRLKETYNNHGSEGEDTVIRALSNADLLIIDDLGTEQNNNWSRTRIYSIIDNRYRNGLPIIITTNLKLEDLQDLYHKRTYDRLLEMCTPVLNDNKSIRVQKGKEKTAILREIFEG